jgi:microcystin-dependent protein
MNQQYHGLWADAGTYSSDDRNKGTGRYTAYESGHTHSFSGTTGGASSNHTHSFTTDNGTGGGLAHNNLQPYIVLNYIIKT